MLWVKIVLVNSLIITSSSQVTKLVKRNVFLSRKKRYLAFPMKSNLVMTMSLGKQLMQTQPKGFVVAIECDVPFPLPSDTRLNKTRRRNHDLQRREILAGMERALTKYGLNGGACVKRMMCEAQQYVDMEGKSLIRDFISAVFTDWETDSRNFCHNIVLEECSVSLLRYILGSLTLK